MESAGERWDNKWSSHSGLATAAAFAQREVSLDMLSSASDPTTQRTSVYKYYDKHLVLIYVGITSAGILRNRQHNSDKAWWPLVSEQSVEHFESRDLAHAREVELIQQHRPPFNVQHNPNHRRLKTAYAAMLDSGALALGVKQLAASGDKRYIPLFPIKEGTLLAFLISSEDNAIAASLRHVSTSVHLNGGGPLGKVVLIQRGDAVSKIVTSMEYPSWPIVSARARVRYVSLKAPGIIVELRSVIITKG